MTAGAGAVLAARAPAKLNLCLFVGPLRDDGLHEICSLFLPIDLADRVTLEPSGGGADEVVCPAVEGPNLAARALAAFRDQWGWDGPPVRLTIEKQIPVAAGLGGGSADAAAALRLAAAHSGLRPAAAELAAVAMSLGADVPSQLDPQPVLVAGAGEELEVLPGNWRLSAVLLTGVGELDTGRVYARADELRAPRSDLGALRERLRAAARTAEAASLGGLAQNDLQQAATELEPAAARALDLLRSSGAEVALVSGSGPAAWGLFGDPAAARQARDSLASRWSGKTFVVGPAPPGHGDPAPAG